MNRPRGNIILTSIFIAIFLFFLSVALIWTNRQDIALSLSMEHKLKAQSAARSAAYQAFARLREFGELGGLGESKLSNGVETKVELLGLEPQGRRGEVLLIRARGKSGPVSSYLTLHLRDVRIANQENSADSRVMFFPSAGSEPQTERPSGSEQQQQSGGNALFGDFILKEGGPGIIPGMVANGGPVFAKIEQQPVLPTFLDYLPVFSEDGQRLSASGPTLVIGPKPANNENAGTSLRRLNLTQDEFEWKEIAPPTDLGDEEPKISQELKIFEMKAPQGDDWTTATIQGRGDEIRNFTWVSEKPPTDSFADIEGSIFSSEVTQANGVVDWSLAGNVPLQQKFVTRGELYAQGSTVYTHGRHFLFKHYNGSLPTSIDATHGSTLLRWPCVLKNTDGTWEKVWTPLGDDGSVRTEHRPDPNILLATSGGNIYTVTEPESGEQRRLLILEGSRNATLGDVVPDGQLILYQDEPYLLPTQQQRPGMVNLLNGNRIGFETLPAMLPEISGQVVDDSGADLLVIGAEATTEPGNEQEADPSVGGPLDSQAKLMVTARPRYDFEYSIPSNGQVAVDGKDLWAIISVNVVVTEPTHDSAFEELPFAEGTRSTLARFDGERWHILPHGIRTLLGPSGPKPPGAGVVAAIYPGLPKQSSRYSIISADTNPFQFGQ